MWTGHFFALGSPRRRAMALIAGMLLVLAGIVGAPAAERTDFGDLVGERRVFAIFAPGDGPNVHLQLAKLCDRGDALEARKLSLFLVTGDAVWTLALVDLAATPVPHDPAALRNSYGIGPGAFQVMLIDRDGSTLLSRDEPVEAAKLFRIIDGRRGHNAIADARSQGDSNISTCDIPSSS